jgi:hypothetical protein
VPSAIAYPATSTPGADGALQSVSYSPDAAAAAPMSQAPPPPPGYPGTSNGDVPDDVDVNEVVPRGFGLGNKMQRGTNGEPL